VSFVGAASIAPDEKEYASDISDGQWDRRGARSISRKRLWRSGFATWGAAYEDV
jgi:hypothetical protein